MDLSRVNFISSVPVIAEVKLQLKNYFESGLLTEAVIPTYIDNAMRKLGTLGNQPNMYIMPIASYTGELPSDFHKLIFAYTYDYTYEYQGSLPTTTGWYTSCTEVTGSCPSTTEVFEKIVIESQAYKIQLRNPLLLKVVFSDNYCTLDSPNYSAACHDELVIKGNIVTTTFPDGYVYIKYFMKPTDDDGIPLIPEIIEVEDYIKSWCKYQLMEQVFNGSSIETYNQARDKFDYYRQDAYRKFESALNTLKMQDKDQVKRGISRQKKTNLKHIIT